MLRWESVVAKAAATLSLCTLAIAPGCGSSSNGDPTGDGGVTPPWVDGGTEGGASGPVDAGPVVVAPGQLAVRVNLSSVFKARTTVTGPWTSSMVLLNITLANGSGAPDVPASIALFSVKGTNGLSKVASNDASITTGSLTYRASYLFPKTQQTCDATLSVSGGASITCNIVASFDGDVDPVEIKYLTPGALAEANGVASPTADKRSTSTPFSAQACTPCDKICTDTRIDAANCGKCGMALRGSTPISCQQGKPTCGAPVLTACVHETDAQCVELAADPYNCGACGVQVPNGATCTSGQIVCGTDSSGTSLALCGNKCIVTDTDDANCGACGHACTGETFCAASTCVARTPLTGTARYCSDFCLDENKKCANKNVVSYSVTPGTPCSTTTAGCSSLLPRTGACNGQSATVSVSCACY